MTPSRLERFKRWICMKFGHKLKFSHTFGKKDIYICQRCKVVNDKQSFDLGKRGK